MKTLCDSFMPAKTNRYANKERNHVGRGRELERKGLERSGHHGIFVILKRHSYEHRKTMDVSFSRN